jgi:protein involved in polysaccharide export with SLBB domain
VRIRRTAADGQSFVFSVNADKVFEGTDEEQNVVVKEGDIVFVERFESSVPQANEFVYVLGKVNNRGRIPIVRGRYPFTLMRLMAICGDFQEFADRGHVKIIRQTETGKQHFVVDFDQIIDNERADFELKPDDVIFVPETFF